MVMLSKFLVWTAGAPTMPSEFKLTFNVSEGLARAPVAHTCGNVLELSTDYKRYDEFKRECTNVLTRMMFIKHYVPNRCLCINVTKLTMCN